jgi:Coenzyme PQQ synthesis protein D (PqqD)
VNHITKESTVVQSESVLFTELAGGITLMNMDNAKYYHFDEVGAAIWRCIDGQSSVGDICSSLMSQFDADRAECEQDTFEFLNKIVGLSLIEVVP